MWHAWMLTQEHISSIQSEFHMHGRKFIRDGVAYILSTIWFYSRWRGNIHFVDYSTGIGFLKSRLSNLHSIQLFDST